MPPDPIDRDSSGPPEDGPSGDAAAPVQPIGDEDATSVKHRVAPPAPEEPDDPAFEVASASRTQALSVDEPVMVEEAEGDDDLLDPNQAPTQLKARATTPPPPPSDAAAAEEDVPIDDDAAAEFVSTSTQTLTLDDAAVELLNAPEPPSTPPPLRGRTMPPPPPPQLAPPVAEPAAAAPEAVPAPDAPAPPPAPEAAPAAAPGAGAEAADEFAAPAKTQALSLEDGAVEVLASSPRPPPARAQTITAPPPPPPAAAAAPAPEEPPAAPAPSVVDEALAEAADADWKRRADELRAELDAESDKARAAFLAYELGELHERRLRDEAGSVKLYGRALKSDPSLRPNLWAIRRVFYRRALWPNLLKLLDAEIRFARHDRERADLYVEKAFVLDDRMKNRDAAREALDKAIALAPDHQGALLARERIALLERDDATLDRVWRALADAVGSPRRKVTYLLDLARLRAKGGDEGIASALELLAEAMAVGAEREAVARERVRLAELARNDEALLAALEARVALCAEAFGPNGPPPAADLPGEAGPLDGAGRLRQEIVALRRRQARVAMDAGRPAEAWGYLEQAAALSPGEPLLLMDLADLAEDAGRWEDLAALCARLASLDATPARQLAIGLRRADALARAGRHDEADAVLDGVVASAPGYLPVTALRERRALEAGAWERIASLYVAEAAAARLGTAFGPDAGAAPDPAWAAAAYTWAGDVYAVRLGRDEEARTAYGQALEALPGYTPAAYALAALDERAGRLDEACALIEAQLAARADAGAELAELAELDERLARLYGELGRPEDALRTLARLAERRPDDASLRWRLQDLLAAAGRTEERAQLLERLAEKDDDPLRRSALQLEIARIYDEELDRPERAAELYRQALATSPGDRYARAALAALLRRAGRWEELVAERRAEAESAGEGAGVVRALREAAAILERRLGRPADAAAVYRELADRVPDDLAAVRGLASTLGGQPEALVDALEREAELLPDGPAKGRALVKLGELYERLGRDADATGAYRRARDAGAGDHAGWALLQLAGRLRDALGVAEALGALACARADEALRADLIEELAWLEAGEAHQAAQRFEEAQALAPDKASVRLGLALSAARLGDAARLAAAVTAQAENTSDRTIGAALLLRAATLSEVAGVGDGSALAARAQALLPDDPGAILEAAERPAPEGAPLEARDELLGRRAALAEDPEARADLAVDRAEELERAGRLAEAGRVLGGVLGAHPGHLRALVAVRRIARRAGDHETRARAAFQLGQLLEDPESAAVAIAEAARLVETELARPRDAAGLWRAVLERLPLDDEAYARARALLVDAGDTAAVAELLSHRLRHVGDPREEIPYRLERAALAAERRDLASAAHDLTKVLAVEPAHPEALSRLADVRLAQGDAAQAAELLARYLETTSDPRERAAAELRRAALLADRLADVDGAVQALEKVLDADPDHVEARERLVAGLERKQDFGRAVDELQKLGAKRGDRLARARDELRAARLCRERLSDRARARKALERARTLDPLNLDVVRELAGVVEGEDRRVVIENALADVRQALVETPTRASLYDSLAAIAALGADALTERLARGALVALGGDGGRPATPPAATPKRALTADEWGARLEHPGARGPLTELWATVADAAAQLGAHQPAQLGFAKGDRLKKPAQDAPFVDAWARAFGLGEYELYVSASRSAFARAVALETPAIFLGVDVAGGERPEARFLLGRALAEARLRAGALEDLGPADLEFLLAAAVRLGGGDPARFPVTAEAARRPGLDERAKALGKVMSRRDRKALPLALGRLGEAQDTATWRAAVRASARRAALLVCGDLPAALAAASPARGAEEIRADDAAVDLLTFGVSEAHVTLRKELGLG